MKEVGELIFLFNKYLLSTYNEQGIEDKVISWIDKACALTGLCSSGRIDIKKKKMLRDAKDY